MKKALRGNIYDLTLFATVDDNYEELELYYEHKPYERIVSPNEPKYSTNRLNCNLSR